MFNTYFHGFVLSSLSIFVPRNLVGRLITNDQVLGRYTRYYDQTMGAWSPSKKPLSRSSSFIMRIVVDGVCDLVQKLMCHLLGIASGQAVLDLSNSLLNSTHRLAMIQRSISMCHARPSVSTSQYNLE